MAFTQQWTWGAVTNSLRGGLAEFVAVCNRRLKALEVFLRNPTTDTLNIRGTETSNRGLLWLAGAILDSTAALIKSGFYLTTRVSGAYGGGAYIFPTLIYTANGDYMFGAYIGSSAIETGGKTGINYESLGIGGGPDTITGGGNFALSNGLLIAHPSTAMAAATMTERVGLEIQSQYYGALVPGGGTAVYALRTGTGLVSFGDNVDFTDNQALNFRIENRTSDPGTPTVGELWLRTDL
jgi:hypothetical protein